MISFSSSLTAWMTRPELVEVVLDDLVGDLVHLEDLLALDVGRAGQSQVAAQGAGQVVVLDALGGVEDGIHQDQEMIGPVVAFLVFQQEVHERLFELQHDNLPGA